ncbi:MAG TPA: dTDP-glucose 4,6-dehydratase [Methanomicrobiales archaeon]|nr:dTDP-glucose 4,6-dehydratase [Methanomicrobiales archaeon]
MVLLVTGIAGFIGTNFGYYYLNKYDNREILGVDKLTYSGDINNFNRLKPDKKCRLRFLKGDIADKTFIDSIFRENDIHSIINFAAESHVDRSIQGAQIFIKSNILGTFNLIDCAKQNLLKHDKWPDKFRFVQISTDEVYGSLHSEKRFTEDTPLHPNNPYSASKASADLFVQAYCNTYHFPGLISRCSNNYGPYQYPEKLIPVVIQKALDHQPIPIYGDGKQIRDWLYVNDHCSAIDCILEKGTVGEIYNIGGNNEWSNIDLVNLILSIIREITHDSKVNTDLIRHVNDRPGHDRRYAIDATKIKTQLKWQPTTRFEEGLRLTIDWYIQNQDWMKSRNARQK